MQLIALVPISFVQDGIGLSILNTVQSFAPPGLKAVIGSASSILEAQGNAKRGVSDVFAIGGLDYPWVCPCSGFSGVANITKVRGKCPVDANLGCYTPSKTP
jgi:uncharacterized Fe-S cluster protein YjdI